MSETQNPHPQSDNERNNQEQGGTGAADESTNISHTPGMGEQEQREDELSKILMDEAAELGYVRPGTQDPADAMKQIRELEKDDFDRMPRPERGALGKLYDYLKRTPQPDRDKPEE